MHVLRLGWVFPPFIAGGLGTACHGLTKALYRRGMDVTFVLPKVIDRSEASHVNLVSPQAVPTAEGPKAIDLEPSITPASPSASDLLSPGTVETA